MFKSAKYRNRNPLVIAPVRCSQVRLGQSWTSQGHCNLLVVRSSSHSSTNGSNPSSREALLTQREDKLWNRMEQLLDREAQMREEERRAARSREQHLQSQLDMVLSMVSKQQTDRSLPPSALASQLLESRASTPQESAHTGPAHQPHGTFDADDSQVDQEVQAALDSVSSTSRSAEPGPANEVHDVINAVLSNQIDPLKDDDFFAQYGAPGVADVADDVSDATSPAPPATPPASSPTSASTASANGGAVPPHVVASLGAAQSALQASASGESGAAPLEHQKASPDGPPPVLSVNDDDICWAALLKNGCYCGEMDEEDLFFGAGTQNAVLTFQAMQKLPETGLADEATWKALGVGMGGNSAEDGYIWQEGDGAATASNAFTAESSSSASPAEQGYVWQQGGATGNSLAPSESTDSSTAAPFGGLFNDLGISTSSSQESSSGTSTTSTTAASDVSTSREVKKGLHKGDRQPGETPQFSKFPVLREGDGDRAVHTLHVLLRRSGFYCDEEDTKWWMFGSATMSALQTFQACNGLPESGVCCERTWQKLMGPEGCPEDIDLWWSGDSEDEDMEQMSNKGVYLLGEQRWSTTSSGDWEASGGVHKQDQTECTR